MSYLQAFIIAVVKGVTELFPVSSLGHAVLIPAWIGGSWQTMVTQIAEGKTRKEALRALKRRISDAVYARLVGHASTRTTEVVYRRELRPMITTGAEIMDEVFGGS